MRTLPLLAVLVLCAFMRSPEPTNIPDASNLHVKIVASSPTIEYVAQELRKGLPELWTSATRGRGHLTVVADGKSDVVIVVTPGRGHSSYLRSARTITLQESPETGI